MAGEYLRRDTQNYKFEEETSNSSNTYDLSGRIMLTAIVVLIAVILLVAALHVYARWYLRRVRRRRRRSRRHTHLVFYIDSAMAAPPGLDSAVVKSLPVFVFSGEKSPPGKPVDCAVCLSEFQEKEEGRRLPKCNHSFHTECIDMWFQSHDTCPLCRTTVEMYQPEKIEVLVEKPVGSVVAPPRTEEAAAAASEPAAGFGVRRKVKEMIAIEVPKRNISFGRTDMEFMYAVKSPVSGILSLRRILNREGGRATPSPSSVAGCSTAAMGGWDVEKEKEEFLPAANRAETPKLEV